MEMADEWLLRAGGMEELRGGSRGVQGFLCGVENILKLIAVMIVQL